MFIRMTLHHGKREMKLLTKALYSLLLFENNLLIFIAEAVAFYLISANFPLVDGLVRVTGFLVLLTWRYLMYMVYEALYGYLLAREDVIEGGENTLYSSLENDA